jgi:hypothetical protein
MRFAKKTQVAAGVVSMAVLAAVTAGCEKKPTPAQEQMASRIEAAASKSEMAASKAEQAAKNAADAAARTQACADKCEATFQKYMRK